MKKLIFVYNADSDLFSTVSDFAHKIISPKTYVCSLCSLTYGNFGMKKEWAGFVATLKPEPEFLHRDEFIKKYGSLQHQQFPAIFVSDNSELSLIAGSEELNNTANVDELRKLLLARLYT